MFWIGLSSIPGVGRATFGKLIRTIGSPDRVLSASREELEQIPGVPAKVISAIRSFPWQEHAEKELAQARASDVAIITRENSRYPEALRHIPDPPLFLYVKGDLLPGDGNAVAIVGTRKPTHYGISVTRRISEELSAAGITIVSGMARGIDTEAHRGALSAKGRTIAVLGCGVDVAYPPENRGLMEEIGKSGAVLSENPFGTQPESGYFPARNRIISGLARGTVIIEASEDSGSLITAQFTREQDRKLFAVPGNIGSPASKGANSLIKQGAALVEGAADILQHFNVKLATGVPTDSTTGQALTNEETAIFTCVNADPKHIDAIMAESGSAAGKLSGILMSLELKGVVRQLPGKYFVRQI